MLMQMKNDYNRDGLEVVEFKDIYLEFNGGNDEVRLRICKRE